MQMEPQVSLGCEPCLHPEKILIKDGDCGVTECSFQCREKTNTAMGCLDTSRGGKLLHCIAGGNVGHLHKLQGIESSSQFVNKLRRAKEGARDIMDRTCADLPCQSLA